MEVDAASIPLGNSYTTSIALNVLISSQLKTSNRNQETMPPPDEDVEDGGGREAGEEGGRQMSLSTTLDNCVIFEEFIKELGAILSARRGLRIDPMSFV